MLDIGVGAGRTTLHFAPRVRAYFGIDLSHAMIRTCRRRFPGRNFQVADVRALPFGDGAFDFILFSFNGLDYVPADDRSRALQEIRRVGRAGGRFCFSAHNLAWLSRGGIRSWLVRRMNPSDVASRDWAVIQDGALLFGLSTYYIRPEAQIAQLRQSGFDDIQIFGSATGPYLHYLCRMA
jgi:SAM-dependent methyltransferase